MAVNPLSEANAVKEASKRLFSLADSMKITFFKWQTSPLPLFISFHTTVAYFACHTHSKITDQLNAPLPSLNHLTFETLSRTPTVHMHAVSAPPLMPASQLTTYSMSPASAPPSSLLCLHQSFTLPPCVDPTILPLPLPLNGSSKSYLSTSLPIPLAPLDTLMIPTASTSCPAPILASRAFTNLSILPCAQ